MRSNRRGDVSAADPRIWQRKDDGRLSWSRSYITAWTDGYRDAEKHQVNQQTSCSGEP
jgi:hypothetical protein